MSYQGEQVNFSQVSDSQFSNLIQAVGQTNVQVATNSRNLVNMGKDMTKIGQDNTYFGKAITNLDNAVRQIISKGTGGGMTREQVENIVENSADRNLIHTNLLSLGNSQQAAKLQRDSIEAKVNKNKSEHSVFHTKLQSLGDSIQGHSDSPHNQGGGFNPFDFLTGLSTTALAAVGVGAYLLMRKK
tara:strand:+ start:698 stop:1255 length:558 start_codon:yes stop_codon:yes gene_type:complete